MGYTKAKINVSGPLSVILLVWGEMHYLFTTPPFFKKKKSRLALSSGSHQNESSKNAETIHGLHPPQSPPHSRCWINICWQSENISCLSCGRPMITMGTMTSLTWETFSPEQSKSLVASFWVRFKSPRSGRSTLGSGRIRVSWRPSGRAAPACRRDRGACEEHSEP